MDISSIKPNDYAVPQTAPIQRAEAAQRRELITAAKSVNASGLFGQNQLVFLVDPQTRRPVIRVEDRDTHEVLLQLPPEYVLRLAKDLRASLAQTTSFAADM